MNAKFSTTGLDHENLWLNLSENKKVFVGGDSPAYVPGDVVDFSPDGHDYRKTAFHLDDYSIVSRVGEHGEELTVTMNLRAVKAA